MSGEDVAAFLSGLLIGSEILNALALYPDTQAITLVAEGVIAENYKIALEANGLSCNVVTPESAFIKGLLHLTLKG